MTLPVEKTTVVKSLAGAIQEKFMIPTERGFRQIELHIKQLEKRLYFFCYGLTAATILALVIAIYSFFHP